MSHDATVAMIRALVQNLRGAGDAWDSFAVIIEFGEGYRSASGYAYPSDGSVAAVAVDWNTIESPVDDYLGGYFEPGDPLPLKLLVQFDRTTGAYDITFEDEDADRWSVGPSNFRAVREELRPSFGG